MTLCTPILVTAIPMGNYDDDWLRQAQTRTHTHTPPAAFAVAMGSSLARTHTLISMATGCLASNDNHDCKCSVFMTRNPQQCVACGMLLASCWEPKMDSRELKRKQVQCFFTKFGEKSGSCAVVVILYQHVLGQTSGFLPST